MLISWHPGGATSVGCQAAGPKAVHFEKEEKEPQPPWLACWSLQQTRQDGTGSDVGRRQLRQGLGFMSKLCFCSETINGGRRKSSCIHASGILYTSCSFSTHFCQEKFMARLEIVVTKKASTKVTIDGGWYSDKEMRDDLKWTPNFDGIYKPMSFTQGK